MIINGYEIKPYADLRKADLRRADLWRADLRRADLRKADLRRADLRGANLREAGLWKADLWEADLWEADLWEADLRGAKNIPQEVFDTTNILPEGDIIGWKKASEYLIKLFIPKEAKRSNATGRKCRAEYAKVLWIEGELPFLNHLGDFGPNTKYKIEEYVYPDKWDEDRWNECSNGIHFFITRGEAERYA